MMSKVHANFYEVPRDGRCKTDAKSNPPAATYTITSPLLGAKKKKGDEIVTDETHPFWAVVRQVNSKYAANMELEYGDFDVIPRETSDWSKACVKGMVTLPMLRNSQVINQGDLLTVPFNTAMEEDEEDDDE